MALSHQIFLVALEDSKTAQKFAKNIPKKSHKLGHQIFSVAQEDHETAQNNPKKVPKKTES
jgi:hypothetical protein